MKLLRLLLGLACLPLCVFIGSLIPIGAGNGLIVGLFLGIVLSCLFFMYGPGKKGPFPTSYYLNQYHQMNGGVNRRAIENNTLSAWETAGQMEIRMRSPRP